MHLPHHMVQLHDRLFVDQEVPLTRSREPLHDLQHVQLQAPNPRRQLLHPQRPTHHTHRPEPTEQKHPNEFDQVQKAELVDEDEAVISRPRPPLVGTPKILMRPKTTDAPDERVLRRPKDEPASLLEREAKYNEVRARIFGQESGSDSGSDKDPLTPHFKKPTKAEFKNGNQTGEDPDYNRNIVWGMPAASLGLGCKGVPVRGGSALGLHPAGCGRGGRGSGPNLPRRRVSPTRVSGRVIEWKGKYGWIQAHHRVEHPGARRRGGKIFVSMADILCATKLEPGDDCEFYIFEDEQGLGAEEVEIVGCHEDEEVQPLPATTLMAQPPPTILSPTYSFAPACGMNLPGGAGYPPPMPAMPFPMSMPVACAGIPAPFLAPVPESTMLLPGACGFQQPSGRAWAPEGGQLPCGRFG